MTDAYKLTGNNKPGDPTEEFFDEVYPDPAFLAMEEITECLDDLLFDEDGEENN